ncbi:MAG: sensor histidine kinase [Thermoleophilaceae bacterium]
MRLPIRTRLTVTFVVLLALVIATLGAFVLIRLRADMTADVDRSLRSAATQIGNGYERGGAVQFYSLSTSVMRVLPADSGSQLVTANGRLARASGGDVPRAPLLTTQRLRRVLAGDHVRTTTHGPTDTEPFRIFATAVTRGSEHDALVVAASLEGIDTAVHRVLVLLLIAGPAALLAVAAGGWWLARAALRPVERLTRQAETIELDRLDERVPVPRTSDEVARLAVTLNRMLERLDRGVEEKRRLVADASHELRTPLAVMCSELDVALAYERLQPEAREVLTSTHEEVERMARTVENLLTLARADEGRLELMRRPMRLRQVADEVAADLGPVAAEKDVALSVGGDGATVDADRERVRQVVTNLVDNAVKHSRPGGTVRVAAWRENGEAGVRVSDEGAGIPADVLPQVFDRFYRVDSARVRDTGGSGLGLAICREIATAHGGRVWAVSEEGCGSTFALVLPADPGKRSQAALT